MKDRIRQLMESQHMNQQSFANHTGIATASLSNIFAERTRPTLMHVDALKKSFPNLSTDWLVFGTGEMFIDSPTNPSQPDGVTTATISAPNGAATPTNEPSNAQPTPVVGDLFAGQIPVAQPSYSSPRTQTAGTSAPASTDKMAVPQGFAFGARNDTTPIRRKITEIRVFYDDQTWESFVPKK